MNQEVINAVNYIRSVTDVRPLVALTLGSGLGNFADNITIECTIPYKDIPGFAASTAPGHQGEFIIGTLNGVPVICMKGRIHLYEGYPVSKVVLPARVMHALGAKILFLTNACGGSKKTYHPGTLAIVTDHISCFVPNPLLGPNDDDEGVRFPDMSHVYDEELRDIIKEAAKENGIDVDEGVYVQLTGPSYETPAEIRMLKGVGADLFGMSTVVEAITGVHMGMRVCCVSLVTNMACGISEHPLSHEEVTAAGLRAEPLFTELVRSSIIKMKSLQM